MDTELFVGGNVCADMLADEIDGKMVELWALENTDV